MRVLKEGRTSYPQDPTRNFDFERFNDLCGDYILIEGLFDFNFLESQTLKNSKVVYLEFEEPNRFFVQEASFNHTPYEDNFDKIFTICPYTATWLNREYNNQKRTPVYFPFNENDIPPKTDKVYDIIYTGHISSPSLEKMVGRMTKYNYCLVSNSSHPVVTHKGASYKEKLALISKSKITLTHNLLYLNPEHIHNVNQVKNFRSNEAYKYVPDIQGNYPEEVIVPQLKSRLFEAAFCRSLILCRRDPWNIVECYFKPDSEFIYYDDDKLEEMIEHILNNYEDYLPVINDAYERAVNSYTTERFFQDYLRDLK